MPLPGEMLGVTVKLIIATAPPIMIDSHVAGLQVECPLVTWQVQKQRGPSPDTATISITNLDVLARTSLATASVLPFALQVSLFVGWAGIPELLIRGQAVRVVPAERTETDVITTIELGDGALAFRDTPPQGGAVFGASISTLIALLVSQLGMVTSPAALALISAKAATVPVPVFQIALESEPRDLLTELMSSIGLDWGSDGGVLVVYEAGTRMDLPLVLLGPTTGLIRFRRSADGAYDFEALAQPRVVPGVQLQFLNALMAPIGPLLRVDRVSFQGTTEGGSTMSGTARQVLPLPVPPAPLDPTEALA